MNELRLGLPDDWHVHLRQGPGLAAYAARTATSCGRMLVMPNTLPPVADGLAVDAYRAQIAAAAPSCQPLMTFKLLPGMGTAAVAGCLAAGCLAGKYYPAGATTNAADGVADPTSIHQELAYMEDNDIVLSIHGENPAAPALERETEFLPVVDRLIHAYPRLRIVLEHLSTASAVAAVLAWPERVAATITAHHLFFCIDDLLGGSLQPGLFCKPPLKSAADRRALVAAAVSGSPRFFFGSDSAPHPVSAKLSSAAPAGCYTAPVALPLLAEVFAAAGALSALEHFTSRAGANFYRLPPNRGELLLTRQAWQVPSEIDGCLPPAAGRQLAWQAVRL
ncbi:MAG: hypothetical protein A2087_03520 [Spirochaetes bacterium GWD1_61_31]|nr:MAG: hypothetical protein A2Y37_11280 [Spirochaetes bacterium GWB1_60_80]OHD36128.1 MAG: hypothetical protein A2087_03520 [Spirochaetes bacterium GWD1_61_31]OHD45014.1 MAG: hypothetical protein A2Y35_13325 [Spirochaetes bacterium GWE1_60_18]OHD60125.1 MAG: hypothetical protein A2Y32_11440 [Spirochaetes bacterium GWF1_60_12]HAP43694.1 dihydroorotase [Spirochaetaceae bacterium]